MKRIFILSLLVLLLPAPEVYAQKRYKKRHILRDLKELPGFRYAFVGFMLYDPESDRTIACQYDNKYMTPASNTKLYTFYAGTRLLGQAVPAMQYVLKGDSLIFWGTGNPLFLHPDVNDRAALDFLSARKEKLFYRPRPMEDFRFGPGWSWDDYAGYDSAEKSVFPIYGNSITSFLNRKNRAISIQPPYFRPNFQPGDSVENQTKSRIDREETKNLYRYFIGEPSEQDEEEIDSLVTPFLYSDTLFVRLLADTLNKPVSFYHGLPQMEAAKTLYSMPVDTLFKHMLQPSDNLFAEQILLMASGLSSDTLSTKLVIDRMQEEVFHNWQDAPVWVDGSGLSRYNMFTPRNLIRLLKVLREEIGEERLFALLPAGGVSGTLNSWYEAEEAPYVFAKTGTLSNNHSLTGYLKTNSGKTLLFSIMVNHYAHSTRLVRESMGLMLGKIRKAY